MDKATLIYFPIVEGGYPASSITDSDGKYQLTTFTANDGTVPVNYTIKISKYNYDGASDGAGAQVFASSEEELEAYELDEGRAVPPKNLLPMKYTNPATSGLTYTVPEADSNNDIEIDLK